jgi:uncharacterized membrane protein
MHSTGMIEFDAPLVCIAIWIIWGGWILTFWGVITGAKIIIEGPSKWLGVKVILSSILFPIIFMTLCGLILKYLLRASGDPAIMMAVVGFYLSAFSWRLVARLGRDAAIQ